MVGKDPQLRVWTRLSAVGVVGFLFCFEGGAIRFVLFMVVELEGEEDGEGPRGFWPSAWKHAGTEVEKELRFRLGGDCDVGWVPSGNPE